MNFYIDPYVFAIEESVVTKEEFEQFINNLIGWKKLIDLNWGKVYKPTKSFEILLKNELYPLVDSIKALIKKYHIEYIQPQAIDKIISSFLDKLPTIEESSEISDIVIESDNFKAIGNRNDDFVDLLKKMSVILEIDCSLHGKDPLGQILITKEIDNFSIEYDAIVSLIDYPGETNLPYESNVKFACYENFITLCHKINPTTVWLNASDDVCISMAIFINVFQLDNSINYIYSPQNAKFVLYYSFFESIAKLGFKHEKDKIEMLIRALCEEIFHQNMNDTHELRDGKSGASKKISLNGYVAWRRDINYDYHLHYWKKGDKLIFTDVVVHDNFKITSFETI